MWSPPFLSVPLTSLYIYSIKGFLCMSFSGGFTTGYWRILPGNRQNILHQLWTLRSSILEIINYEVWVEVDTVFFNISTIDFDVNLLLRTTGILFPGQYIHCMKLWCHHFSNYLFFFAHPTKFYFPPTMYQQLS